MNQTLNRSASTTKRPNVLLILNDDMGYSDIGCYGGEVQTPNLDRLAARGLRFTQFYNTARCCPSRASLLTGLHPHQADVGSMTIDDGVDGYLGNLSRRAATIAEVLRGNGYHTLMSGKWHVSLDVERPNGNWPCERGFDECYGMIGGATSYFRPKTMVRNNTPIDPAADDPDYYITDAITDEAVDQLRRHAAEQPDRPFFQYVAYTAPHWPLHARAEDIAKYKGRFDAGWDVLRAERLRRMVELGAINEQTALSPRDPSQPAWDAVTDKAWESKRMEAYAAQIDSMDQGIGRILQQLEESGQLDNTLVIFLADNGGCAEVMSEQWGKRLVQGSGGHTHTRDGRTVRYANTPDIIPGPEETYASYGVAWANLSNTPFRMYKCWIHEGGIATPFIVHWPKGIASAGEWRHQPAELPDVMATILDATGSMYPTRIGDREIIPHEGFSMRGVFEGKPHHREILAWEHEGCCGVRRGKWKLVRGFGNAYRLASYADAAQRTPGLQPWELFDIDHDRSEVNDLAGQHPEVVAELEAEYNAWAARCQVRPFSEILEIRDGRK